MLTIDAATIDQLRWYFDTEYEGDIGYSSSAGRTQDLLERGAFVQSSGRSYGVSPRASAATARLRFISSKLAPCTPLQRAVLNAAFATSALAVGDFLVYGSGSPPACTVGDRHGKQCGCCTSTHWSPMVVLQLPDTLEAFQQDTGSDSQSKRDVHSWLVSVAHTARNAKKHAQRTEAQGIVDDRRRAAESALAEAVLAYGGQATLRGVPVEMSLEKLARKLHMRNETCANELRARGVPMIEGRGRKGWRIRTALLATLWPEKAALLAG